MSLALAEPASPRPRLQVVRETPPDQNSLTSQQVRGLVDRVVKDVEGSISAFHNQFVDDVERRYKAFRGYAEKQDDIADWMSQVYPAYALQILETITANMIDDELYFDCKPRPKPRATVEELQLAYKASFELEQLLRLDEEIDRFVPKQRPIIQQNGIAGMTVVKTHWDYMEGTKRSYENQVQEIYDEQGFLVARVPRLAEVRNKQVLRDNSCTTPVDVRDFFWPEGAKEASSAHWLCHRVWLLPEEVEEYIARGIYRSEGGRLLQKLSDAMSQDEVREYREQTLFNQMRTKGFIEILEYWHRSGEIISVGNRRELVRYQAERPFHHDKYPFTVISSMPDLFRIGGVSDVELIEPLQRAVWNLTNQTLDNVKLLNNGIVLVSSDFEDPDELVFAPLERWIVDNPDQVKILDMPAGLAEIAGPAIARLMGDMQNVTGGMPFVAGAESSSLDQKTATGISIVTSLAQRRLQARKQHFTWGFGEITDQRISLIQQYMRRPQLVPRRGESGAAIFLEVLPENIAPHEFMVEVKAMTESLMRQERRAEAQALFQIYEQAAALYAAMGLPLNGRAFMDDLLESFGKYDTDYYYSAEPQPAAAGAQPGQPGQPGAPGQENLGVTSSSATDASAPSATGGISQSPAVALQRAMASGGGAQGAPVTS